MSIWLIAVVASLLVPVVVVFMACEGGTTTTHVEPGTSQLDVDVNVDPSNPNLQGAPGDAQIVGGSVTIQPPSGAALPVAIPPGGLLNHPLAVDPAMFAGASAPYRWSASCNVQIRATQPVAGAAAEPTSFEFFWDANAPGHITIQVYLRDRNAPPPGTIDDSWDVRGHVYDLVWSTRGYFAAG